VAKIPALGLRQDVGEGLARDVQEGETTVELDVRTDVRDSTSMNVIAEPPATKAPVVLAGAHLDSVPVGPGVNDNGSGVATLLEIAEQLGPRGPANIRFAFWGGEEAGLVGSRYFVDHLDEQEAKEIALYFNLDMLGSPNFERLVYRSGPDSRAVMRLLSAYFKKQGLESSTVELGRSSDHAPFVDRGIPVSGLFSGAGEPGPNGKPYDSCYHERCDDLGNVDFEVLHELADATAYALLTVASDLSLVE
jgi:Zn-dependent M28 family amino/carboxypeptidase